MTRLYIVLILVCSVDFIHSQTFAEQLSVAALSLVNDEVQYDPSYYSLTYPNGDVPSDRGVCTDVIIRAFRKVGIDLQKEVHEDMRDHFNLYPNNWGLKKTDQNIDHRRVPNLMTYFTRKECALPIFSNVTDYLSGDIVAWDLGGGSTHIGILVNQKSTDGLRYLVVHNIGAGQVIEDCLFSFEITGHYRFKTDFP